MDYTRADFHPPILSSQVTRHRAKISSSKDLCSRTHTDTFNSSPKIFSSNPDQNLEPHFDQVLHLESEQESVLGLEVSRSPSLTAKDYYQITSLLTARSSRDSSQFFSDKDQVQDQNCKINTPGTASSFTTERKAKDKNRHFKVNSHYEDYEDFLNAPLAQTSEEGTTSGSGAFKELSRISRSHTEPPEQIYSSVPEYSAYPGIDLRNKTPKGF